MIQITAMPTAALPNLPDAQNDSGMESTISADFAALLAKQGEAAAPAIASGETALAVPHAKAMALTGKPGGKSGGKPLPLLEVPNGAWVQDFAAAKPVLPDEAKDNLSGLEAGAQMASQPSPFPLPGLPVFTDVPMAGQERAQQEHALPLEAALKPRLGQTGTVAPDPAARLAIPVQLPPSGAPSPAIVLIEPPMAKPIAVSAKAPAGMPQVAVSLSANLARGESAPVPQVLAQLPEAALPLQATVHLAARHVESAAIPAQAAASIESQAAKRASPNAEPRPPASGTTGIAAETAVMAPLEATATPAVANTQPATTASTALPSQAVPQKESPADFSTLVDRLVAARETAQASLGMQAVHAAVAHAEFGKVTLRFEQQDGALNVAMTSADPDFARSVLAAAPASQQSADNSERSAPSGRQDGGQSMAQPQGQGQSQASGQSPQRSQTAQTQPQSRHPQQDDSAPSASSAAPDQRRRGIFA